MSARKLSILRHCSLVAILFWLAGAAGLHAEDTVKIGTLNCEFLIKDKVHEKYGLPLLLSDPKWTPELKAQWTDAFRDEQFKKAAKAVAKVIKKMDADVIALCEVGKLADVEELRMAIGTEGLNYPHISVCNSSDISTGQHVAVLSKRELTTVSNVIAGRKSFDKELDEPDEEGDTGISKGMHVSFEAGGKTVNLFVAHLASERLGFEQDAQRLAQASIIRRTVVPLLDKGAHVIVAGDFNAGRGTPALRRMMGRDDFSEDLIQTAGPVAFPRDIDNHETNEDYNKRVGTHWTYEFSGQRKQIDHVLISRSLRNGKKSISTTFFDTDEKIEGTDFKATDHRSLVVTIKLP